MNYKKVLLATTLILTYSNAQISFLDFSNICEKTESVECTNNPKEIKIIQKLLNIGKKNKLKLSGEYDTATKNAIIAFQKENNLPATGFVGMQTKIALEQKFRELKYKATHKNETKVAKNNEKASPEKKIVKQDKKDNKKALALKAKKEKEAKLALEKKRKSIQLKKEIAKRKALKEKLKKEKQLAILERKKKLALKKKKEEEKKRKALAKKRAEEAKKLALLKKKKAQEAKKLALLEKKKKKALAKKKKEKEIASSSSSTKSFEEFRRAVNLRKSYRVYKDYSLLKKANGKNTTVKISVKDQRINLLVNGKVALCAPCTTGSKHKLEPNTGVYRDKRTPYGTFKIMEKIATKRSNIFGEIYVNGKVVYKGDRRKYSGPKGKFVGHPLKNWMRLTSGGIGLHASKYVKRYPGSNGCVRLPKDVSQIIFSKVSKGTKVVVSN